LYLAALQGHGPLSVPEQAGDMTEPVVWRPEIGCNSDVGVQRDLNEDSMLVLGPSALPSELDVVLAVDDGIGGHQAGDIAS